MQLRVRDWMIDLLVYIDPDSSVSDALALMRRRYIHSLVVSKSADNPVYGIVTATDVCDKIIAGEADPSQIRVRDIMTSHLITVQRDSTLQECAQLMKEHHIHHLPVADEDGGLVGMISATDFLVAAESLTRDVPV
jgi:CBS domain-containing protein